MLSTREISALMRSVAAVVKDHVGEAVRGLSVRMDELDARIRSIPAAEKGEDGQDGKDGRDGVDGASITADDVLPALRRDVQRFLESIPAPRDGKDGCDGRSVTLEDVKGLLAEIQASWALDFERRAQDTLQRAIDRMPAPRDGTDGRDGRDGINGKDGRDALDLDDIEYDQDEDGRVTLRLVRGDFRKEIALKFPVFVDRGVFKEGERYERGNGVTWGGSFWIAQKDDPEGKPGEGDGFRLAVKKGRDAK